MDCECDFPPKSQKVKRPLGRPAFGSVKPKPLTILCPAGHRFLAPRSLAGCEVVCPYCGTKVPVPDLPAHPVVESMAANREPREEADPSPASAERHSEAPAPKGEGKPRSDVPLRLGGKHRRMGARLLGSPGLLRWFLRIRATQKEGLLWAFGVALPIIILTSVAGILALREGSEGWTVILLAAVVVTAGNLFLVSECPDWMTFRLLGLTLAAEAVAAGVVTGWVLFAPLEWLRLWQLAHVRDATIRWAASLCAVYLVGAFLLFRAAAACRRKVEVLFKVAQRTRTSRRDFAPPQGVSSRS